MITFAALLSVLAPVSAQEIRGFILGRITDPSGAAVPGARITVANEETNTSVTAQSNEEGNYNVPFLAPGRYTVTAEANGFKKAVRGRIIVQVQDKLTLNFSLEPGDISESVTVTAETPLLQKANAGLGQVVTREFLDRLPLIAQSPLSVADMAPGVISSGGGTT
ncbi:MAG: carboxypeptidase-like regulatory domain-containing protein, partial [Acidobacteria bacterium]|nr:carboxypeptidase-like regulatory domain-containing protein [Acidobacteriota bacterium]